jgi:hypothetical protein
MRDISLRPATSCDVGFAFQVTEACMRDYAEQTWGRWDEVLARKGFDPAYDKIIQLAERDIGLIGVDRRSDHWFLDKLYLLPTYQN